MSELDRLSHLLADSTDRNNPDAADLRALLATLRRIAVVGISRDPLKAARRVPSYLTAKGVDIIPVNPNATWLLGKPALRHLGEFEGPVDLVLVFRPSAEAGAFVADAAARPEAPAIWLQEGIRADRQAEEARAAGRRVVQDLCLFKAHRTLDENMPSRGPFALSPGAGRPAAPEPDPDRRAPV
ncbi:MAG: CoA-binding protein [Gemmatimonadales bacterium]|nr:MAG: CoA-binding protein [Gemmatimonadales bacterium]